MGLKTVACGALALLSTVSADHGRCLKFDGADDWGYAMSTRYCPGDRPDGAVNNAFVFAMSRNFFGETSPPYWAMLSARGKGDAATAAELIDKIQDCTDCSAAGLFVFYNALGEYCETNNQPGFQLNEDRVIHYNTWQEATWLPLTGQVHEDETGHVKWFEGTLTELSQTFTLYCRGGSARDDVPGVSLGPYEVKCDITFDFTGKSPWSSNATAVDNCPDSDRFLAFQTYVGSGAIDNTSPGANPDASDEQQISADSKRIRYTWKKQLKNHLDQQTDVVADIHDITEWDDVPTGFDVAKMVIFSVMQSKADATEPVWTWDPELIADDIAADKETTNAGATLAPLAFAAFAGLLL